MFERKRVTSVMLLLVSQPMIELLESRMLLAGDLGTYTATWVGNSDGTKAGHIMHDIQTLYVAADGKSYAATGWEEGGSNVEVFNSDGTLNPVPEQSGTGSWGRMSNGVTTGQGIYVYQSMSQDSGSSQGGTNRLGGPSYPATGVTWQTIRRYNSSTGSGAAWTGGAGYDGSMLITTAKPVGLAVYNNEIYSAEADGVLRVYNATTMSKTAVRSWGITNPGTLAFDSAGYVWMLNTTQKKLVRYSTTGALQSQQISLSSYVPTGFGIDRTNNKIYVANNNVNQNILIYNNITTTPAYSGTFGTTGGIFSGTGATIGSVGPLRFNHPVGVGVDSTGNIYVGSDGSSNMGGAVFEKYNAAGVRQWVKYGLNFVDMADISPASETDIYTKEEHFVMDYSKAPGLGWSYQGYTANPYKYPQDRRLKEAYSSVFARVIAGKTFLYMTGMYGEPLAVYRFNAATDGETAIPAALFAPSGISSVAGSPSGEWVWRDTNGNGAFDAGEYSQPTIPKADTSSWAMSVDSQGTVWNVNSATGKIRSFPVQGLDANGSPIYGYNNAVETAMPAIISEITRLEYDPATDTMYLGAYTTDRPHPSGDGIWGVVGTEILKIPKWSTGNLTPAVRIQLPYAGIPLYMKTMCIAGKYAFACEGRNPIIHVYDLGSGAEVGTMCATGLGSLGWVDIPYGIRAYQRSNGEYLVLAEEDGNGKVLMYRWTPLTAVPAAPSALSATAASSGQINLSWTDNSGNETGFTIERATDPQFAQNLFTATAAAGVTSYAEAGLSLNTTYYFRVAALGSQSNSAYSTEVHGMLRLGDANLDAQVDLTDLTILAGNWQRSGMIFAGGDFNDDGTVDLTDLTILAGLWQTPAPAPLSTTMTSEGVSNATSYTAADVGADDHLDPAGTVYTSEPLAAPESQPAVLVGTDNAIEAIDASTIYGNAGEAVMAAGTRDDDFVMVGLGADSIAGEPANGILAGNELNRLNDGVASKTANFYDSDGSDTGLDQATNDQLNTQTGGEFIREDDGPVIAFVETADAIWGVLEIEVGLLA